MTQQDKVWFAHAIAVYFCCSIEFNKLVIIHILLYLLLLYVLLLNL